MTHSTFSPDCIEKAPVAMEAILFLRSDLQKKKSNSHSNI